MSFECGGVGAEGAELVAGGGESWLPGHHDHDGHQADERNQADERLARLHARRRHHVVLAHHIHAHVYVNHVLMYMYPSFSDAALRGQP